MKLWFSRLAASLGLFFASATTFSAPVNLDKLMKTKWIEVQTENFRLVTDSKEKQAIEIAREMEEFKYFFESQIGFEQKSTWEKITIIVCKSKSTFKALGIRYFSGLFSDGGYGEYALFADAGVFKPSRSGKSNWGRIVVLHEITHLLIRNSELKFAWPRWFNEGTANYFGSYVRKGDTIIIGDLSAFNYGFSYLHTGSSFKSVDTQSLFAAKSVGKVKNHHSRNPEITKFYMRSLITVHYLNSNLELRRNLYRFLYLLKENYSLDESFKYVFQMEFSDLDEEIKKYMEGKHVMARVYQVGSGAVEFPEVKIDVYKLTTREAMEVIIPKIGLIGNSRISYEDKEKMYDKIEEIYPDFFSKNTNAE